jgi:hypothetical protein
VIRLNEAAKIFVFEIDLRRGTLTVRLQWDLEAFWDGRANPDGVPFFPYPLTFCFLLGFKCGNTF